MRDTLIREPRVRGELLLMFAMGVTVFTGCVAPLAEIRALKPEQTVTGAWNRMHEIAADDLACSIEALTTKELSSRSGGSYVSQSFEISGCEKTEIFLIQKSTVRTNVPWTIFSDKQLRANLQFTYGDKCPAWTVEFIDDTSRGVTACDQKTVYVLGLNGWTPSTGAAP